jgi:hypothetical protein
MPPRKQPRVVSPRQKSKMPSVWFQQEAGRGSVVRFIDKAAEVRVNRVTGTIVTVIRFVGAGAAGPLR